MSRAMLALVVLLALATPVAAGDDGCYSVPVTANTPTGIAGCERRGDGIASWYGSGDGAAMNFCTWAVRHATGCGFVAVTSLATGQSAIVPIIDFCDCYTGTPDERIIDLQTGVVARLGLPLSAGLYAVRVEPWDEPLMPDTALSGDWSAGFLLAFLGVFLLLLAVGGWVEDRLDR